MDTLSQMPSYGAVQLWFVQAIPALSKYIRLNAALATHVRFKVVSPTEVSPKNGQSAIADAGSAMYYLGYDQNTSITPQIQGKSTLADAGFIRIDIEFSEPLFNPATFRAPVIHGYQDFNVGDRPYGSIYNKEFVSAFRLLNSAPSC